MLREYELTMIASAQLSEENASKLFGKYEEIATSDGGTVIKRSDWGLKKLSYPIKKQFRGRYMHLDLTAKPEHLAEAERLMRLDEQMLRYLSIKCGEDVDVDERKAELAKIEASQQAASFR